MTRTRKRTRNRRRRRYQGKSKSLIVRQIVDPQTQLADCIPQIEREVALVMGVPFSHIYEVRLRKHQLWVSYRGSDGGRCAQFFSYRVLPIWQNLVIQAANNRASLEDWWDMWVTAQWEYNRFDYPDEIKGAIQRALAQRFFELLAPAA
ncbi:MAG: hypothetical protein KME26_14725 [Oscillatoria princeps RMCB-10]|jgi:hypothetical protein|nr:hypothetical protein [Oscillatoria princeps RMCB-10]